MCALPRKTVIEHEHLIGSALPLPNQAGSRCQFDTSTPPDLSGFVELLCNVAELALRAEPAERDFLQADATARSSSSRLSCGDASDL